MIGSEVMNIHWQCFGIIRFDSRIKAVELEIENSQKLNRGTQTAKEFQMAFLPQEIDLG